MLKTTLPPRLPPKKFLKALQSLFIKPLCRAAGSGEECQQQPPQHAAVTSPCHQKHLAVRSLQQKHEALGCLWGRITTLPTFVQVVALLRWVSVCPALTLLESIFFALFPGLGVM